jgi:uncharacterized protein
MEKAMDANAQGNLVPWRAAVRQAARDAAQIEIEAKWQCSSGTFNYRWEHVQAVVRTAMRLVDLTGADGEIVEAAAWLHDVAKQRDGQTHGRRGAVAARAILARTDFPPTKVAAVADAIAKHVGLSVPPDAPVEPLEAAVLWDADKLTKVGALAVLHFVGYGLSRGQDTAQVIARLPGADNWQPGTVASFQTEAARRAGKERWALFQRFCQQVETEFGGQDLV